ncbi:RNA-directed DNA polymerase, eukaryota [Tanacetum coccineum]
MGKPTHHTDPNGWTWIFRNNKTTSFKPIGNPFHRDVDKVATSFFVTNIPDSLDAKGLWNACTPYGRLIDAFVANKRSKAGKRFGFIRYMGVTDPSSFVRVLLVKLKDLDSASNMYVICKNEGFVDFKIHHVGGSWIWIQFPSPEACENFRVNATMINISSAIRTVTPSFKVDERLIWIEIRGLRLCAWGSNTFKKVACLFGKFMFFEVNQSTSMSTARVCISTKSHQPVSEKVKVNVHGNTFDVLVHEIGTWSINIEEEVQDSSSSEDMNEIEKVGILLSEEPRNVNIEDPQPEKETNTSDLSCPPGFKNFKRDKDIKGTSKSSTSFPRRRNKDIKGISFIHELSRLIEVGSSLGIDVRGCRFDDLIILELSNLRSLSSHEKLKAFKPKIKQWYASIRSNEYSQKNDALKAIKTLEDKIEESSASNEDYESRLKLLHDLDKLDTLEAMDSFKRRASNGMLKGTRTPSFFTA